MSRLPFGLSRNAVHAGDDGNDNDVGNVQNPKENHGANSQKPEGRVLVLYTGGTIGMMRNEQGGEYEISFFLALQEIGEGEGGDFQKIGRKENSALPGGGNTCLAERRRSPIEIHRGHLQSGREFRPDETDRND